MEKLKHLLCILLVVMLGSCNHFNATEKFLPPSTGSVNALVVVIDTALWKDAVGDKIREYFADPVPGLPQTEPLFALTQVPPKVFQGAIVRSRSVLWVAQDTVSQAYIRTNVYAQPQHIAVVKAPTSTGLLQQLEALAPKAINAFKAMEIKEAQQRFARSLSQDKVLEEELGIRLQIPSLYKLGKREDNFVWFDLQIPKGSMNLIAYQIPRDGATDAVTSMDNVIAMRDTIAKRYIPGPYENTYMKTEKAFSPYFSPVEINGKQAIEVRGIWEIHGYPMAGPFISYIIDDAAHRRRLVVEGFAFAPSQAKRNYMLELEAILKTLTVL